MTGIRASFGTEAGLITATTLHTLGAIAVVVALGVHLAWTRRLRAGAGRQRLRDAAFWLTWSAVAANLVGGFMRTYLPGHPTIADTGESPWVQVMLLKHAFIFAALGALVWLHHVVMPRLERQAAAGTLAAGPSRAVALGAWIVVAGVVGASVLGAMAQITPLGEAFEDDDGHVVVMEGGRQVHYLNTTGTLTSTPLAPQSNSGQFTVAPSAVEVAAILLWQPAEYTLELTLLAPDGQEHAGAPAGAGRAEVTVPATPGSWSYSISSDLAVQASWELGLRIADLSAQETLLAETVTIPPGTFFEINTQMPHGASFHWDWRITQETAVDFDVHSHFDDEVQYHVELRADADRGSFTNDREGGYSLLWANDGAVPLTLQYRVWGDFEVDSYFPPR